MPQTPSDLSSLTRTYATACAAFNDAVKQVNIQRSAPFGTRSRLQRALDLVETRRHLMMAAARALKEATR